MLIQSAEESYARGLEALSAGRGKEAMARLTALLQQHNPAPVG